MSLSVSNNIEYTQSLIPQNITSNTTSNISDEKLKEIYDGNIKFDTLKYDRTKFSENFDSIKENLQQLTTLNNTSDKQTIINDLYENYGLEVSLNYTQSAKTDYTSEQKDMMLKSIQQSNNPISNISTNNYLQSIQNNASYKENVDKLNAATNESIDNFLSFVKGDKNEASQILSTLGRYTSMYELAQNNQNIYNFDEVNKPLTDKFTDNINILSALNDVNINTPTDTNDEYTNQFNSIIKDLANLDKTDETAVNNMKQTISDTLNSFEDQFAKATLNNNLIWNTNEYKNLENDFIKKWEPKYDDWSNSLTLAAMGETELNNKIDKLDKEIKSIESEFNQNFESLGFKQITSPIQNQISILKYLNESYDFSTPNINNSTSLDTNIETTANNTFENGVNKVVDTFLTSVNDIYNDKETKGHILTNVSKEIENAFKDKNEILDSEKEALNVLTYFTDKVSNATTISALVGGSLKDTLLPTDSKDSFTNQFNSTLLQLSSLDKTNPTAINEMKSTLSETISSFENEYTDRLNTNESIINSDSYINDSKKLEDLFKSVSNSIEDKNNALSDFTNKYTMMNTVDMQQQITILNFLQNSYLNNFNFDKK